MEKLVSVAIVNWNGEKYLYKCIKSLLEQNYKNIEVIIIDNDKKSCYIKLRLLYYLKIKILDMPVELIKGLNYQKVIM